MPESLIAAAAGTCLIQAEREKKKRKNPKNGGGTYKCSLVVPIILALPFRIFKFKQSMKTTVNFQARKQFEHEFDVFELNCPIIERGECPSCLS